MPRNQRSTRVPSIAGISCSPVAISPGCRLVVAGVREKDATKICLLDGTNGPVLNTIEGTDANWGNSRQAAFSPDGQKLAFAQSDCAVLVWDVDQLLQRTAK